MEGVLITFVVIITPFAFVIAIEWMKSRDRQKRCDLQAQLYNKALESGQSVPADLFVEPQKTQKKSNPFSSFNTGIICVAIGVGIALFAMSIIFFSEVSVQREGVIFLTIIASSGIIPFLIGIAFLIIHLMKRKSIGENI